MADITRKEIAKIADKTVSLVQAELGDDYMVSIKSAKYGYVGFVSLDIVKRNDDGSLVSKQEDDFRFYAPQVGLEPNDFGARFLTDSGKSLEIVGFKNRNRKYPVIAKNLVTGKNHKVGVDSILEYKKRGGYSWQPAGSWETS